MRNTSSRSIWQIKGTRCSFYKCTRHKIQTNSWRSALLYINWNCIYLRNKKFPWDSFKTKVLPPISHDFDFSAFNNPSAFSGGQARAEDNCIAEITYSGSSISISLNGLKSYEVTLKWKVYIYDLSQRTAFTTYSSTFSNTNTQLQNNFTVSSTFNQCSNNTLVFVETKSLTISSILIDQNIFTLSHLTQPLAIS
mgnify:CR=1 FL=1